MELSTSEDEGSTSASELRNFSPPTSPTEHDNQFSPNTSPVCLEIGDDASPECVQFSPDTSSSSSDGSPPLKVGYYESTGMSRSTLQRWRKKSQQLYTADDKEAEKHTSPSPEVMLRDALNSDAGSPSSELVECHASHSDNGHSSPAPQPINFEHSLAHPCLEDNRADGDIICDSSLTNSSDSSVVNSDTNSCHLSFSSSSGSSIQPDSTQSSDSETNSHADENFAHQAAFRGCPKSTDEAVYLILELFISQRLTKKSLDSIIKLFKSLLPDENDIPSSARSLFTYLHSVCPSHVVEIKHFYCSDCFFPMNDNQIICNNNTCNSKKKSVFFEFPIAEQIVHMFEHRNLGEAIKSYDDKRIKVAGKICDILDGANYRQIREMFDGVYDVGLLWNSDGLSLSRSSKREMWPILCTISEVSPVLRSSYVVISGVWCDTKKPPMNLYLKHFAASLRSIHANGGLQWIHPETKLSCKSQVFAPVLCADAPAKAIVLNVKQFNARYGCNVCEQKAVRVNPSNQQGRQIRRFVFVDEEARLRTENRMHYQGLLAEERNKSRKGVKGTAEVSRIPHFSRASGIAAEYMHNVLLGCVKDITCMWVSVKGPWYIGNEMKVMDEYLLSSVQVPDYMNRLPRGLTDLKFWKASELRAWLLYFSLPCVGPFLHLRYVQHWILLVGAIYTLLRSDGISELDLSYVEVMLRCFVRDLGPLYGDDMYTYNFHNLIHLPMLVKRWGPLWATSAFTFEDLIGNLKNLIHGTKHSGQELLNNVKISLEFQALKAKIQKAGYWPNNDQTSHGQFSTLIEVHFSEIELQVLSEINVPYTVHKRAKIGRMIYTSRLYDTDKKRANSYVRFYQQNCEDLSSIHYGQILYIIKTPNSDMFCLVNVFDIKHVRLFCHEDSLYTLKHLLPVLANKDKIILLPVKKIIEKVIKCGDYLCVPPNNVEINL